MLERLILFFCVAVVTVLVGCGGGSNDQASTSAPGDAQPTATTSPEATDTSTAEPTTEPAADDGPLVDPQALYDCVYKIDAVGGIYDWYEVGAGTQYEFRFPTGPIRAGEADVTLDFDQGHDDFGPRIDVTAFATVEEASTSEQEANAAVEEARGGNADLGINPDNLKEIERVANVLLILHGDADEREFPTQAHRQTVLDCIEKSRS